MILSYKDKFVITQENNANYNIYIKNKQLFENDKFILFQQIKKFYFDKYYAKQFIDKLFIKENIIVTMKNFSNLTYREKDILNSKYIIIFDKKEQIKLQTINNIIYKFDNIKDIKFLIPFSMNIIFVVFMFNQKMILILD